MVKRYCVFFFSPPTLQTSESVSEFDVFLKAGFPNPGIQKLYFSLINCHYFVVYFNCCLSICKMNSSLKPKNMLIDEEGGTVVKQKVQGE